MISLQQASLARNENLRMGNFMLKGKEINLRLLLGLVIPG
jgi:hypothetical protein